MEKSIITTPQRAVAVSDMAKAAIDHIGANRLADHFGVSESTPLRWALGHAKPSGEAIRELAAFYIRFALGDARPMVSSFLPWAIQNGIPQTERGYNLLTRLLIAVAASGGAEGCPRCVNSRCRESITGPNVLLRRDCAYGAVFPACVARRLPIYLSDAIIKTGV